MKQEKLYHYAEVLARHADAPWLPLFFLILFFVDSFLMVLPADSLLGATVAIRPIHVKKWTFFACCGSILGLGVAVILGNYVLHDYMMELVAREGFYHKVAEILEHAQNYGYLELCIGVFTIVPSIIGALAGAVVGLNPWVVFVLVVTAKLIKILLTLWLLYTGSHYLKKFVKFYLKTSV